MKSKHRDKAANPPSCTSDATTHI